MSVPSFCHRNIYMHWTFSWACIPPPRRAQLPASIWPTESRVLQRAVVQTFPRAEKVLLHAPHGNGCDFAAVWQNQMAHNKNHYSTPRVVLYGCTLLQHKHHCSWRTGSWSLGSLLKKWPHSFTPTLWSVCLSLRLWEYFMRTGIWKEAWMTLESARRGLCTSECWCARVCTRACVCVSSPAE